MANIVVHEFQNYHSKQVTNVVHWENLPYILTCSLDYTMRVFNLKTFKEEYCVNLGDKPVTLELIDDSYFYIQFSNAFQVWSFNNLTTPLAACK